MSEVAGTFKIHI